MEFWTETTWSA